MKIKAIPCLTITLSVFPSFAGAKKLSRAEGLNLAQGLFQAYVGCNENGLRRASISSEQ